MRTLLAVLLLTASLAVAQTPRTIGYQGRLLQADGTIAQGMIEIRFDFFAGPTGGSSLWSETQTLVLTDGLYSTVLGESVSLPDALFDGTERYLELTIGGAPLTPRQRVSSVPYALVATDPRLLTSCADGEVLKWSSSAARWACAPDDGGSGGGSYVTNADLTAALADYVTTTALTTTLNDYVTTPALANYVTSSALTSTLASYPTTASLTSTLSGYVTSSTFSSTLSGYATTGALSAYVTTSALTSALSNYVTSSSLTSALSQYAPLSSIPTSVHGMTGGTITSSVSVNGEVAATTFVQNGNAVCDTSGNCGRTLGSFNPATSCTTGQVLQWTGSGWTCITAGGGSTPAQPCTGASQALQWDGTSWQCVDLRTAGASGGKANGYEVRDDWGDVWDGNNRPAKTWAEADALCTSLGARLPSVTELWRNRASYGSGNLGSVAEYLWTIAPSYRPGYFMAAFLSNNSVAEYPASNAFSFRCIWKKPQPAGFSGSHCYGPAGAECRSKDSNFNVDMWSRAPQYLASARDECARENAGVMTTDDLEQEILRGAPFVSTPDLTWPTWHLTSSTVLNASNGYLFPQLIRWTKNPEFWWGPDQNASYGNGLYTFRCVGKKLGTEGVAPASPACQGGCFTASTGTRDRLWADSTNRAAVTWSAATTTCRGLGASLPTTAEVTSLVNAGWSPSVTGGATYVWTSSPALLSGSYGWQLVRWSGTAPALWTPYFDYSNSTSSGSASTGAASYAYRCVWREAERSSFLSCAANQVPHRDASGALSCLTSTPGNANGQSNPTGLPAFTDAWGNQFDLFERGAATFATAQATCATAGGRLPYATELHRVRYNQGVVSTELGQATSTSPLWTLNPESRETYRSLLRLSDGAFSSSLETATTPFRCVWPATQPDAFGGHACYGDPTNPCFETGRLRVDRYPRATIPQAAAQWECRQLGGRLPTIAEFAQLEHTGLPNSTGTQAEWSSEWTVNSLNGSTYVFAPARGTGAAASWSLSGPSEGTLNTRTNALPFRCLFTDEFK